ncbi:MAG TPA: M48 family metallopeptidase [Moraxellaceae bacterium]|nr:M48 family metallopeptidase [Moraxellaceae bacterium]
MDHSAFDALITRLEQQARARPARYTASVALVALLGFLILAVALGFSLLMIGGFAGIAALALKYGGGGVALLLAKLGKLLLVLLVPAWMMLRSTWTLLTTRFPAPEGRPLTRAEAPALFIRLDDMRARMKGPRFHRVLLTDEMNAAVVQHPRWGLLGHHENYLILGLPLLQVMSADEAMAVVAHEYGHLAGQHGRFGAFIYRLRNAWGQMQAMADGWTDWGSRLVARLFRWYAPFFNAYTFVLARQNEYDADRSAAELVGVAPAASALARVNIASQFEQECFWPAVNRRVQHEPAPPAARSEVWAQAWREQLLPERERDFLRQALTRVTDHADTHPALADRLRAMGVEPATMAAPAAVAQSAASAWLGERLPAVLAEFDARWREAVQAHWQERHQYLQEQRAELARLRALPAPDDEEGWHIIRITGELEPDTDLMPLLDDLLARHPRHASGLFRRGALRLERADAVGIDDLEQVMAIDPDATLAACQLIHGFLAERDAARAEAYLQRWLARSDMEQRRQRELDELDPAQCTLLPADELPATAFSDFAAVLRGAPKGVKRAWLLRRRIEADPDARAWVLAFESTTFTGEKGRQAIVQHVIAQQVPVQVHVVPLDSPAFSKLRKQVRALGVAPLFP